jgi:hypothetical protein
MFGAGATTNVAIHYDFARIQAEPPATNTRFTNRCSCFCAFHATSLHHFGFYCFQLRFFGLRFFGLRFFGLRFFGLRFFLFEFGVLYFA